ncbi:MAG TPA: hypothetical protein VG076_02160 [Acidimicrobiales bacterium]|nr:hypothetical protein [Acidimicrobiales bacterium]
MTTIDPATTPYQPHAPRSARTVSWAIGRGIVWLVYAFVVVAIVIATLAFFLQLLGANPNADFAAWVYRSAARVTAPFRGLFPTKPVTGDSYLDVSLLFAIIMYGIFGILISELVGWLDRKRDLSARRDMFEQQQAEAAVAAAAEPQPAAPTAGAPHRSRKRPASV